MNANVNLKTLAKYHQFGTNIYRKLSTLLDHDGQSIFKLDILSLQVTQTMDILHTMLNWIFLIVGGLFEAAFAFSLERMSSSSGVTAVLWFFSFLISVSISMFLLYKAISGENAIEVGTGYAVWGGIGAVFTVIAGIIFLNESTSFWRIFFICTLIMSIVGLNLSSK